MRKIRIIKIEIEENPNCGCNNGKFENFCVTFDNGTQYNGYTCRCGNGCSNSDRLPEVGMEFDNKRHFYDYLNN